MRATTDTIIVATVRRVLTIVAVANLSTMANTSASAALTRPSDHAAEDPPRCEAGTQTIPLAGALITPHLDHLEEGLAWDVRFIVDVNAAFDFRGGRLPLAVPLPPSEVLRPTPGVAPIVEADRIVGLCVSRDAIHDRAIDASFLQRDTTNATLGAPLAVGNAVAIIDPTSTRDHRLDVSASGWLEKHVGYLAPRGMSPGAREEARRLTDVRPRPSTSPIYLRGDDVRAAGALSGQVTDVRAHTKRSALLLAVVFAAIVGGLLLLWRRLLERAGVERADALLASEIERAAKDST